MLKKTEDFAGEIYKTIESLKLSIESVKKEISLLNQTVNKTFQSFEEVKDFSNQNIGLANNVESYLSSVVTSLEEQSAVSNSILKNIVNLTSEIDKIESVFSSIVKTQKNLNKVL